MFKRMILIALVAVLSLSVLPISSVSASGLRDDATPPAKKEQSGERLEKVWARALRVNERVGKRFEQADKVIVRIQTLMDKANEKGMDTTAIQSALDAFSASVAEARPIYESAQAVIATHAGFDANGKVVDAEKALATVKSLGESLKEIRAQTTDKGKALREAIKAFREANPRPERTGTEAQVSPGH